MDLRIVIADKVQVYLLFYKPTRQDPIQNRLVSFIDGPFCHVEMAIPDRFGEEPWERVVWGSSIYQDETVFLKQKTYKREGYVSIGLEVTTLDTNVFYFKFQIITFKNMYMLFCRLLRNS